jgi:hypothetical protein
MLNGSPRMWQKGLARSSLALLNHANLEGSQSGARKRPKFGDQILPTNIDIASAVPKKLKNTKITVDFGTTFSSVGYCNWSTADEKAGIRASDMKAITGWADAETNGQLEQVPTVIWYSPEPIRRDPIQGGRFDREEKIEIVEAQLEPIMFDHKAVSKKFTKWGEGEEDRLKDAYFGYEAVYQRYTAGNSRDLVLWVERAKSRLFTTPHTESDRKKVELQLHHLIQKGIIRKYGSTRDSDVRDVRDVITDLLVKLLQHTKKWLEDVEGFYEECPVEWVLAVPTTWSAMASEVMKVSMEDAIRITGIGKQEDGVPINLVISTEPRNAAAWILGKTPVILVRTCFP